MQLSNRVTLAKNTPHNRDYVACSAFPGNGINEKIEGVTPEFWEGGCPLEGLG
jgi:hypothetical protein